MISMPSCPRIKQHGKVRGGGGAAKRKQQGSRGVPVQSPRVKVQEPRQTHTWQDGSKGVYCVCAAAITAELRTIFQMCSPRKNKTCLTRITGST